MRNGDPVRAVKLLFGWLGGLALLGLVAKTLGLAEHPVSGSREPRVIEGSVEVIRGSDNGYAWFKASSNAKRDLCADIGRRTRMNPNEVSLGLDSFYASGDPAQMRERICDVVGLLGAGGLSR